MSLYTRHKVATIKGKVARIGSFRHYDNDALIFTLALENQGPRRFYLDPLVKDPLEIQVDWSLTRPGDDIEITYEEAPCTGRLIDFCNPHLLAAPVQRTDLHLIRKG